MARTILKFALLSLLAIALGACGSGLVAVNELEVGDCFDDPENEEDVLLIQTVPCEEPHQNEVYANLELTQFQSYPGLQAIEDAGISECLDLFAGFVGVEYDASVLDIVYLTPTQESWGQGDRDVTCAVYDISGERLTGSMKGSGR